MGSIVLFEGDITEADVDAVVRAAMGLAALGLDLKDVIAEVDVNPLIALADRAVVVDALIVPKGPEGPQEQAVPKQSNPKRGPVLAALRAEDAGRA